MRRPVTALLLLVFLAAQVYLARSSSPPPSASSPALVRILSVPTGVLAIGRTLYLVGSDQVYLVRGTAAHVVPVPATAQWMDMPQPSGAGVWKVLVNSQGVPLLGLGGPVYTSPGGARTLYVDPGSHTAYVGEGSGSPLTPVDPGSLSVDAVRWNAAGTAAALVGQGPDGPGVYRMGLVGQVSLAIATPGTMASSVGFDPAGQIVAALDSGQLAWEGHPQTLPSLKPAWVSSSGAVLGFRDGRAVWWIGGHTNVIRVAALPISAPRFHPGGQQAGYVAQVGRRSELVLLTARKATTVPLPGGEAVVTGWIGSQVVVAILGGPNQGTYLISGR